MFRIWLSWTRDDESAQKNGGIILPGEMPAVFSFAKKIEKQAKQTALTDTPDFDR